MNKQFATLDFARPDDIAMQPTVKAPAIRLPDLVARISNPRFVRDAKAVMLPGETPDALFVRLLLYYLHNERIPSDTVLVAALERSGAR